MNQFKIGDQVTVKLTKPFHHNAFGYIIDFVKDSGNFKIQVSLIIDTK